MPPQKTGRMIRNSPFSYCWESGKKSFVKHSYRKLFPMSNWVLLKTPESFSTALTRYWGDQAIQLLNTEQYRIFNCDWYKKNLQSIKTFFSVLVCWILFDIYSIWLRKVRKYLTLIWNYCFVVHKHHRISYKIWTFKPPRQMIYITAY